jgi:hypothetical protein
VVELKYSGPARQEEAVGEAGTMHSNLVGKQRIKTKKNFSHRSLSSYCRGSKQAAIRCPSLFG